MQHPEFFRETLQVRVTSSLTVPVTSSHVAGSRTFSTASPDSITSFTCAQCEPAVICEEHRAPVATLPILVFSGKCQTCCTVLGCKHNPHLWTSGPHTTLMESVSDRLSRNMHICGLLEVILQGSGSAPPAPPCTKAEVAVLLLSCCPPTASSTSPDVLACLLFHHSLSQIAGDGQTYVPGRKPQISSCKTNQTHWSCDMQQLTPRRLSTTSEVITGPSWTRMTMSTYPPIYP
ncbi:unnamed protein product [Leuciscus chuanchicus]